MKTKEMKTINQRECNSTRKKRKDQRIIPRKAQGRAGRGKKQRLKLKQNKPTKQK